MKSIRRNALWVCLLFAPLAQGAPPDSSAPVDEVVIEATRANLVKLGKEVQLSQQRFYERYNQLNKKREYAVKCSNDPPIGSRFTRMLCQPEFQSQAERDEAQDFFNAFLVGSDEPGHEGNRSSRVAMKQTPEVAGGSPSIASSEARIVGGRPGFQKHMLEVTSQSPELTKMAQEHARLWKRFYEIYRELNGAGPPPEEKPPAPRSP